MNKLKEIATLEKEELYFYMMRYRYFYGWYFCEIRWFEGLCGLGKTAAENIKKL